MIDYDIINKECPYCHSKEIATGISDGYARITKGGFSFRSSSVTHEICTDCGAILFSKVRKPQLFTKKGNFYR